MQMDWVLLGAVVTAAFALGGLVGQITGRREKMAPTMMKFGPQDALILETDTHLSEEQAARMQADFKLFIEAPEPRALALPKGWRVAAHLKRGSASQNSGNDNAGRDRPDPLPVREVEVG